MGFIEGESKGFSVPSVPARYLATLMNGGGAQWFAFALFLSSLRLCDFA